MHLENPRIGAVESMHGEMANDHMAIKTVGKGNKRVGRQRRVHLQSSKADICVLTASDGFYRQAPWVLVGGKLMFFLVGIVNQHQNKISRP